MCLLHVHVIYIKNNLITYLFQAYLFKFFSLCILHGHKNMQFDLINNELLGTIYGKIRERQRGERERGRRGWWGWGRDFPHFGTFPFTLLYSLMKIVMPIFGSLLYSPLHTYLLHPLLTYIPTSPPIYIHTYFTPY